MKKRLFRNLLVLGLLLVALTVMLSAVNYGGIFYPESGSSPNTVAWDTSPSEYIVLNATVSSTNTKCNACSGASKVITLSNVQYPANGSYHQLALTVNLPEYTCGTCKTKTGPFNNLTVEFSASNNEYFCHSSNYENNTGNKIIKLTSSVATTSNGNIEFEILAYPRNFDKLSSVYKTDATCTTGGISQDCFYCNICNKYFTDKAGTNEITTPVKLPALGHDFDTTTGKCNRCDHQATASLNDVFKESLAAAVADYNSGNGGTLRAFISPEGTDSFTLRKSGTLIVTEGVTIPKIILEENPTVTIENAGTITSIEMGRHPGTLTIKNHKQIDLIKTDTPIDGNVRTINVTNYSGSTINKIEAPNTMLTVQNDGTIGELIGYFHSIEDDSEPRESMVTLLRGAGIYQKITSWKLWAGHNDSTPDSADFSKLLSNGVYFYFENEKKWRDATDFSIKEAMNLQNVYCTGLPIASIDVTGTAGGSPVELTRNGNSFSMTVTAGQDITLTGIIGFPTQGLRSDEEHIVYRWSGATGNGKSAELKNILFGEYDLTLTVADDRYNHSQKVNIHIIAQQGEQKTPLFLKKPTLPASGFFERPYNGTSDSPYNLQRITFYTTGDREITVDSRYYDFTVRYPSPNCTGDDPVDITATVWLTAEGKEHFTLGTDGTATFTVPGKITQASAGYKISTETTGEARVGDRIFTRFMLETNFYYPDGIQHKEFLSPETNITVDSEPISVTFYRLHPSNITSAERDDDIKFISDPELDEALTKDSVFKYAGKYYIYAVVQPTTNYEGEITNCRVIDVQETEASSAHHNGYTPWDGTSTVPVEANKLASVYLSGSYNTIYTELLLSRGKELTLCLNGKTLSATNSTTSFDQIRVTDGASLTIEDCAKTGTAKGTVVSSGAGGIAYVQNGTITIKNGKFTGGTAKTGGGAIVVDNKGVLTIEGGEISGNTVTSGNGGAIYIKSGGVVNIYGGTIKDNHVYSGSGGAIYVEAGGTLNLYGGTITGNTASGLGGGIYVEAGGRVNIQGAPVVTGNTAGGKPNNVYVCVDSTSPLLTISGELTDGAKLGVSTDASYPVLLAGSTQDYSAYFTPDDPDAFVLFSGSALTLCAKPSATLEGDTLTVSTGSNYKSDAFVLFVAEYGADGRLLAVHSEKITAESGTYTFKVQPGATIKCFLLHADTYAPLFAAFSPKA